MATFPDEAKDCTKAVLGGRVMYAYMEWHSCSMRSHKGTITQTGDSGKCRSTISVCVVFRLTLSCDNDFPANRRHTYLSDQYWKIAPNRLPTFPALMAIPSSMRAVRFFHNDGNGSIKIHDEPVPEPGPKEILVKVRSAGVCHSDLQVFDNPSQIPRPADWSLRPGHEAVGTAVKLGSEVTKFKVGDHLGTLPYLGSCGDCDSCRQVCPLFCPTARVQGFFEDGFVAEYALFGENQALKLPDGMNPETSAPLFCAGLTAFHGVDKAGLSPGQWLAVVGVGGLGTFGTLPPEQVCESSLLHVTECILLSIAVQYALKMGFKVVALDVGQTQLQLAEKLGATAALDSSSPDVAAKVRELTSGGVHAASCFSGSIKAYESAISVIRPAGTLVVVGVVSLPHSCSRELSPPTKFRSQLSNPKFSFRRPILRRCRYLRSLSPWVW
jgi:propanol-preferring alcohol dehydrogenase